MARPGVVASGAAVADVRPSAAEVTGRPLPDGVWRLDWLLPPGKDLVTPSCCWPASGRRSRAGPRARPRRTNCSTPVCTSCTTGSRGGGGWGGCFSGDAAHLLGALGTQGLDEGLRDADNLAWKLALAWHHGPHETLLDSYQEERRSIVAARLRAADQALPLVRGGAGLRAVVPGSTRNHDVLLTDGHLGRGALGAPGRTPTRRSHPCTSRRRSPSTPRPARPSPTSGSPPRTAPSYGCGTASGGDPCWSYWSRRARACGSASTG